ncbi:glutathione S-transferase theta-1 isoform X2 [Lutra lutra]|uniref:glutathione S-transferase theta-1 isoform X2 n=1 Tax=Lutra lutra TaxID=9657 RepID=UPI001FD157C9|nr:glutathione S-transferase theta-1 isoform X2 [Lutra lutra]
MGLELYLDLLSQPCRAVYIFAKKNRIPFELRRVDLLKGQHLSDAFAQVNPLKKVPALKDGDFTLAESVAILLYLTRKYKVPDHWYPQDVQACALVDEYLAWQHTTLRRSCLRTLWHKPVGAGCQIFEGRPKLAAWRQRVEAAVGEDLFQEAHEVIMKARESPPADPTVKQKLMPAVLAMIG